MVVKSALVTGGTTRLGLAIAERLRADGYRVITSSHRADSGADIICDLADPMGPAKLYAEVMKTLGGQPPDALVNNAALYIGDAETLEAVDFIAPKKLTMLMAGRETASRGAVVNILDTKVLPSDDGMADCSDALMSPYLRAKRSLYAYTLDSAVTYSDTIRVNAVAPGPVLAPTQIHEAAGELLVSRPKSEDVAAAVSFLLSVESVTGCVIPVDGGQHLL